MRTRTRRLSAGTQPRHLTQLKAGCPETVALAQWIERSEGGHYVVKRLKAAATVLTAEKIAKLRQMARGFVGRSYDLSFEWSDERMYCSEIVWKLFDRVLGIQVGQLQMVRDFDLSDPAVRAKMKERYGDRVPLDMRAISPRAMFESPLLETIIDE